MLKFKSAMPKRFLHT